MGADVGRKKGGGPLWPACVVRTMRDCVSGGGRRGRIRGTKAAPSRVEGAAVVMPDLQAVIGLKIEGEVCDVRVLLRARGGQDQISKGRQPTAPTSCFEHGETTIK